MKTRSSIRAKYIIHAMVAAAALSSTVRAQADTTVLPVASGATHTLAHSSPAPMATATRRRTPIVMDGKLDDAAWRDAAPITELQQFDPDHGKPSSEAIDVRFLYDDNALYVGARLSDKLGKAGVTSTVVRRDAFFNSDFFEVVIDGFHDHLGRAFFQVNPSGSKTDVLGMGSSCCDSGWDPVWDARTSIDSGGWSVEMRIPYSQLRFSRDSVQTWGLEIRRYIKRRDETDQWAMWERTDQGGPQRFGHLEGVRIAHRGRNVEILPYAAQKLSAVQAASGDPFNKSTRSSVRGGLDLKYLLTPNLTLDATVNPDFGQVEVDPAVVNLSAFEQFFQERRPFFVSSSGVFDFGEFNCNFCNNVSGMQAFYSRRVGRAPTGADLATANGAFADVPTASAILGAAKITGRTSSGYTIGVLNAVTERVVAPVQRVDGSRTSQAVEPMSNFFVGRLKKDFLRGDLVLGVIGTSVVRRLDTQFVPRLSARAELLGTDWRYAWKARTYSFIGSVAVSSVEGDSRVILNRQLASARFFQRPGRTTGSNGYFATRLDSSATSLHGYGGYARLAKDAGNWQWETAVNLRNPGFETNDYSFLTNADYIWKSANLIRAWQQPGKWYRNVTVLVGGQNQHNFDGDITNNSDLHTYIGWTTPQFWNVNLIGIARPSGTLDDRLLRGGPAVRVDEASYYGLSVSSDSRKQWQLRSNPGFGRSPAGGGFVSLDLSATVQPSSRVYVSVGPSYNDSKGNYQYVTAVTDPTLPAFGGKRYLLADIHQRQLGFDTRVNVTFSPTMTLELYAQPLLASGLYSNFKEFTAPRSGELAIFGRDRGTVQTNIDRQGHVQRYTIDPDGSGPAQPFTINNPDFNFRSLRGSVVYRWEYRPGSTVYLVWTQQRSDQGAVGDFNFGRDRAALLSAKPDNVILVKASWWLAR